MDIDQSKISTTEYSMCGECAHDDDYINKCCRCTHIVGIGDAMTLCGIGVGCALYYLHSNFEYKEKKKI